MNKIKKMIEEMCANGVDYKKINELIDYIQPSKYIVYSTNYDNSYKIPVLTPGKTFILGYTNETKNIYNASKENPIILFDDFTCSFHWVDFPFKVKSSAAKILIPLNKTKINFRYIYFVMTEIKIDISEHKRQWIQNFSNISIPLPPIEIQNEIVRILDKYTELEKELEKELELRTKQYEYYRNKLLDNQSCPKEKLSNIVQLNKFKQIGASELESFVDLDGDVTLLPSSRNYDWKTKKEYVKKFICNGKVIALGRARHPNIKYCDGFFVSSNNHLISLENENKVLMRYLYHFIDSKKYSFYVETSTYPKFDLNTFKNTSIPVPSIQEQQKIADILDKFLNIIKDFKNGIPKQIELKHKQYLYYRDKLLNFEGSNG